MPLSGILALSSFKSFQNIISSGPTRPENPALRAPCRCQSSSRLAASTAYIKLQIGLIPGAPKRGMNGAPRQHALDFKGRARRRVVLFCFTHSFSIHRAGLGRRPQAPDKSRQITPLSDHTQKGRDINGEAKHHSFVLQARAREVFFIFVFKLRHNRLLRARRPKINFRLTLRSSANEARQGLRCVWDQKIIRCNNHLKAKRGTPL